MRRHREIPDNQGTAPKRKENNCSGGVLEGIASAFGAIAGFVLDILELMFDW
jgi:hypothetical protein